MQRNSRILRLLTILSVCFLLTGCINSEEQQRTSVGSNAAAVQSIQEIPEYTGEPYVILQDNEPDFKEEELVPESYETYGDLDELGRCTAAIACIGTDLMPTEKRGNISQIKPTGWHSIRYDEVEGGSLYNRSHLIGFQLTAENANEKNLITGTRYMNAEAMLPFENMVADYIKETGNHVLYRVTPIFEGDNLVVSGVEMEAESVEDAGEGIRYHVYVYNVQPGISIEYETGRSRLNGETEEEISQGDYILNTNTRKFHKTDCSNVKDMKGSNKKTYTGTRDKLLEQGYTPCGGCNP